MDRTLKEALSLHGFTCERVYSEGMCRSNFIGMRVLKDGVQIHEDKILNAGNAWEIVHSLESFVEE